MPLPSSICRLAMLICTNSLLLYAPSLGQNTEFGTTPSLRQLDTQKRVEETRQPGKDKASNWVIVDLPSNKILTYYPELKDLVPATSQDDLTGLLAKVGAKEDSFLFSLPNLSAQEDVTLERLDKRGWAQNPPAFTGHYRYLLRGKTVDKNLRFEEGRTDQDFRQIDSLPNGLTLAQGFALFPLQFHPLHQLAARFRYLGRQALDNRQDYVVAFVQEVGTQLTGVVTVNGRKIPVVYQGIAWIEPENFEIVRMRVDLLKPEPEVGWQKTEIQFSEVRLPLVTNPLWLPLNVTVTKPTREGATREKHEFSDYRVFVTDVKTVQKPR